MEISYRYFSFVIQIRNAMKLFLYLTNYYYYNSVYLIKSEAHIAECRSGS